MRTGRLIDVSGVTEADLDVEHLEDLLRRLSSENLRGICHELSLPTSAPNKDAYVERILSKADLGHLLEVVPRHEYHGGYNYLCLYRCLDHQLSRCESADQLTECLSEYGLQGYINSLDHIRNRETGLVYITMEEEERKVYFEYVDYKAVLRLAPQAGDDGPLQLVPTRLRYPVVVVLNQDRGLLQVRLNGYTYNPVSDRITTADYARDVTHYLEEFAATVGVTVEPLEWRTLVRELASVEDNALIFSQKDLMPAVGGYLSLKDKDQGLVPFLRRLEERIKQRMDAQSPGSGASFNLVDIINEIEMDSNMPRVHLISPDGRIAVKIELAEGREFIYFGASPDEEEIDYVVSAICKCL